MSCTIKTTIIIERYFFILTIYCNIKVIVSMAKEDLDKTKIRNNLDTCFKKCAMGRIQLRKCVQNAMNVGLTKQDILDVSDEMADGTLQDEAPLCAITAIGQALRYETEHKKTKSPTLTKNEKEELKNKLKQCFKKCAFARKQLRKCVVNALNAGLTKEEVLALTDDLIGGFGKDQVSVCAIVAVDEILKYEEIDKLKKTIKMYAPYMEFNK